MPLVSRNSAIAAAMRAPYEKLAAWQRCHELALTIRKVTRPWPREEFALVSQLRRASYSAAANVAEGSAKKGPREFRRYLDISLGSLSELEYGLTFARDAELLDSFTWESTNLLRRRAHGTTRLLYNSICERIERLKSPTKNPKDTAPSNT